MRRWIWLTMALLASCAHACSWSGPVNPIEQNLAVSRSYFYALLVVTPLSYFAVRQTKRYWLPAGLAALLLLDWAAMGTAHGGDCGSTSRKVTFYAMLAGTAILAWCSLWLSMIKSCTVR